MCLLMSWETDGGLSGRHLLVVVVCILASSQRKSSLIDISQNIHIRFSLFCLLVSSGKEELHHINSRGKRTTCSSKHKSKSACVVVLNSTCARMTNVSK